MSNPVVLLLVVVVLAAIAMPVVFFATDYLHVLAVEQSWYEGAMR